LFFGFDWPQRSFATESQIGFFETSAKTNLNVAEAVHQLVRLVAAQREIVSPAPAARTDKRLCLLL
jgi:hypothetical protein